ncbi:LysR substrate-binding domain-containing protein [Streptomyces xinghaiensis]|uniref:LysR substrate-binding domain-containing protein n=1 Tax=Streptomyces xinghaiensis TaxID=1038928 RepID=UPI00379DF023
MRTGRLDAAVISVGETVPEGLASVVVDDQPLVAAVAPGHELAVHTRVPLAALRGHALISLPGGTGLRARLDEALRGGRLHPRIAFEAGDPGVLAGLAARGLGWGWRSCPPWSPRRGRTGCGESLSRGRICGGGWSSRGVPAARRVRRAGPWPAVPARPCGAAAGETAPTARGAGPGTDAARGPQPRGTRLRRRCAGPVPGVSGRTGTPRRAAAR